jgi:hypothetical protein
MNAPHEGPLEEIDCHDIGSFRSVAFAWEVIISARVFDLQTSNTVCEFFHKLVYPHSASGAQCAPLEYEHMLIYWDPIDVRCTSANI